MVFEDELNTLGIAVDKLEESLNNNNINVNQTIKSIIANIRVLNNNKKTVAISRDLNRKFENIKKKFTKLKGIHIQKYNERVSSVRGRSDKLAQNIINKDIDSEMKAKIKNITLNVKELKKCDLLTSNSQWTHSRYLDLLEYDRLEYFEKEISELELKLKIKSDILDKLFTMESEIDDVVNKIRLNISKDVSINDINIYINDCQMLLNRLLVLETEHESLRNIISNDSFGIHSGRIVSLRKKIEYIQVNLLEVKRELSEKDSLYVEYLNSLEVISDNYDELDNIIIQNESKGTLELLAVFNTYLKNYHKKLDEIKNKISSDGKLNQEQVSNLNDKINLILQKHNEIDKKLNVLPFVIKKDLEEECNNNKFSLIDKKIEELRNIVSKLEAPLKDKDKRKKISSSIKDLENSFVGIEGLLAYYEKSNIDEYKKIKQAYDERRDEFDNICNKYNSCCPLGIKTIRSAKQVYKRHKKMSLVSAGLASVALLTSSYTIIPAIMHGNVMLGSSIPVLSGVTKFFNKILGSLIGASVGKNGMWVLATGAILNANTATTSILKFLATIGVGTATLVSPLYVPQIVTMVKKLVDKIKNYELKQKLSNAYENTTKKLKEVKDNVESKIDEYDLRMYYDELYSMYIFNKNNISLDEFCKKQKLSLRDKKILELKIAKEELNKQIDDALRVQVKTKGTAKFV